MSDLTDLLMGVTKAGSNSAYMSSQLQQLNARVPQDYNTHVNPEDIPMFRSWDKTGPTDAAGMLTPGNIDLTQRPLVRHPNGGISSLYSYTIKTPDNKWLVVPGVTKDGQMLTSEDQAANYYQKTGEHLGIFDSLKSSDAYANLLHLKQGAFQTYHNGGQYKPNPETFDNWWGQ